MVCGETGRVGLNVPRLVVEERLRGQENVTVLHHPVVGMTVRVMLLRPESVTSTSVKVNLWRH